MRADTPRKHIQHQAQNNRKWKRKYEAAEAMKRRGEFTKHARQQEDDIDLFLVSEERRNDELVQIIIESIYADLQHHYLHPKEISVETYDPYRFILARKVTRQIFHDALQTLGQELLCILMTSQIFCNSMQRFGITALEELAVVEDQEYAYIAIWDTLLERLLLEGSSLRAFALSRRIHYVDVYRRSAQGDLGKPIREPDDFPHGLRDPYEVYHAADGRLRPTLFWPNSQNSTPQAMKNISRNIYSTRHFQGYSKPDSWPSSWTYPAQDIQHPCREWGENFPPCVNCGQQTGPPVRSIGTTPFTDCSCSTTTMFSNILVEIKEYDSYVPGALNRGVRALQSFPRGCILGEYLGEFVPLNTHNEWGDESYAIEFEGPPYARRPYASDSDSMTADNRDYHDASPIATLIAGANGSWTRFINAPSEGEVPNCAFRSEVLAGKLTITVRAIKQVRFGEQLLVDYGEEYWNGFAGLQFQAASSRVQSTRPARSSAEGTARGKTRYPRFYVEEV